MEILMNYDWGLIEDVTNISREKDRYAEQV